MTNYKVGIIDDDSTKVTQLLTYLKRPWHDNDDNLLKEQYKDIIFCPKDVSLLYTIDEMVSQVKMLKFDALIIDYKLSSQQSISYNGVNLAETIDTALKDFPIFVLTSFKDDLYTKECFDVYQVFDFERYISDIDTRLDINSKIVEKIRNYKNRLKLWEEELLQLLPQAGKNVTIDQRILELDSYIESRLDGNSALPDKLKEELSENHIQRLIDKIESIIREG